MNNYSSQDYQYTDGQIDRERERDDDDGRTEK